MYVCEEFYWTYACAFNVNNNTLCTPEIKMSMKSSLGKRTIQVASYPFNCSSQMIELVVPHRTLTKTIKGGSKNTQEGKDSSHADAEILHYLNTLLQSVSHNDPSEGDITMERQPPVVQDDHVM